MMSLLLSAFHRDEMSSIHVAPLSDPCSDRNWAPLRRENRSANLQGLRLPGRPRLSRARRPLHGLDDHRQALRLATGARLPPGSAECRRGKGREIWRQGAARKGRGLDLFQKSRGTPSPHPEERRKARLEGRGRFQRILEVILRDATSWLLKMRESF